MSASPFLASAHGHPNFNPVKMPSKNLNPDSPSLAKNSKQPKPPDKPLMPYMRYSKKVWDDVRARYPDLKIWEISKIVGQMWRELPDEDKQDYIDAFESEKVEYNELLKAYHNSPAYQSWLSLKTKAEHEDRDSHKRKEKKSTNYGLNSPQKSESRISLQSLDTEIDEEDDYYSMKHLAAARFYRNHKLVTEVFSDFVVPDVRSIVTNGRLQILRKQVDSLTMHQNKLDEELKQLEERFQDKKRCLIDSSEKFCSEINKRFASKTVDEATYQKMFDKALEQIRKENSPVLTVKNDIQPTSTAAAVPVVAPVLPNDTTTPVECVDDKVDNNNTSSSSISPMDTTTTNPSSEDASLKVVTPNHERPFTEQSTDSNDSQEFHNLKENIPMHSQPQE